MARRAFAGVKRSLVAAILIALLASAVSFYYFYMLPRRVTPILMYHSVGDNDIGTLSVRWDNFEKQVEYLHKHGYSVISLGQLVEAIEAGRTYLPKTVAITFDDGFQDNYTNAMPALAKYKMPATVFIITGYIGRREGYLDWGQVVYMARNGFEIGGHTRNNAYLPAAKDNTELLDEIKGPKEDIEAHTGIKVRFFCYPLGAFNEKVKSAVKLAGYKGACTTNRGNALLNNDVYELKRVKVTNSDTNRFLSFEAKLSGFYNIFRRKKEGD